jgi:hypothetical protein
VGDSSGAGPGSGSGGPGSPDSGQPPDADHGGKGAHDGKGDHPKPEHGTEGHDKDHGKHDGRDDGKHDHSHDKNHGKDGHGTHGHDGKGAGKTAMVSTTAIPPTMTTALPGQRSKISVTRRVPSRKTATTCLTTGPSQTYPRNSRWRVSTSRSGRTTYSLRTELSTNTRSLGPSIQAIRV